MNAVGQTKKVFLKSSTYNHINKPSWFFSPQSIIKIEDAGWS